MMSYFLSLILYLPLNKFAALILLAYIEALHYACVVMEKWDMSKVGEVYPRAQDVVPWSTLPEVKVFGRSPVLSFLSYF